MSPFFAVAVTFVGASGVSREGVTELDVELGPVPTELVADTAKEYEVPFVRPEIVVLLLDGVNPVQCAHDGDGVTVRR